MSLFSNIKLGTAWSTRSREIEAHRLQEHSDLLYECLRSEFVARRQLLQDDLLHVILNATSRNELSIPIWTYKYMYHGSNGSDLDRIRYEWSVGLLHPWTTSEDLDRFDGIWEKTPVSVESVFRKTDILQRLALLFGDDYRISIVPISVKILDEARVATCELRLNYYPNGLPDYMWYKHDEVRQRYTDYAAPEWVGFPYVWSGYNPALPPSRASTPPPALVPDEPPVLPRRSNGGGVQLLGEDFFDGVSRRLSFNVSPCHCGYHHDEED